MLVFSLVLFVGTLGALIENNKVSILPPPYLQCMPYPLAPTQKSDLGYEEVDSKWIQLMDKGLEAKRAPRTMKNSALATCPVLENDEYIDKRSPYYWQVTCPYSVNWLRSIRTTSGMCYVVHPCFQRVRFVTCSNFYCLYTCLARHSVCLERNYQSYRVFVFCPSQKRCLTEPKRCFRWITVRLPQCCECLSCRHVPVIKAQPESP